MKKLALLTGVVLAAATAALALGIFAAGKEGAPGFFGPGVLIADVNLTLEILLVLGLTFGFLLTLAGYWAVALLGFATYYFWYSA